MSDLDSAPADAYANPTPWSLISNQRHAISPPLTQPSIDLLQQNAQRFTDDDGYHPSEETLNFNESDLEAVQTHIWRTNHPLLPTQSATVEELLNNAYSDFFKVDKKIDGLSGEMNYIQLEINWLLIRMKSLRDELIPLQKERAIRQEKVNKCLALTSAVRLLPPEILGLIFTYAKPEKTKNKGQPFPYDLCHVCFAWRQAAFALPALWNTDKYTFGHTDQGKLSFTLTPHYGNYDHGVSIQRTLHIIAPFFRVLASLHLRDIQIEDFFALPAMSFPVLETVQLSGTGNYFTDIYHSKTRVFEGAEELRKLMLDLQHFPHSFFDYFPWSQIAYLDIIRPVRPSFIITHFIQAVNLEYASIAIDDKNPTRVGRIDSNSIPSDLVTFDKLRDFRLMSNCFNTEHIVPLFSHIRLPALTTCVLKSKFWDGEAAKVPLFPALSPSIPTLHTLTLSPTHHGIDDVGKLLRECTMLSSLTFILNDGYKPSDNMSLTNLIRLTLNHSDSTHSPILLGRLSRLASFNVIALCYNSDHLGALTDSFRRLILSWANDPCGTLLRAVSLSVHIHRTANTALSDQMAESVLLELLREVEGQLVTGLQVNGTCNQIDLKVELIQKWEVVMDSWRR
ncbi:hypothetical protein C0995_000366 [Termitomyces sp. Mi166|nr:hypothetical protein C0995_000366 [Termitomyces sp. Mi166\